MSAHNDTTPDTFNTMTAWSVPVSMGSPFSSGEFSNGKLEWRCVGWGVKVKMTGAPLYRQGMIRSYLFPQHRADRDAKADSFTGTANPLAYLSNVNARYSPATPGDHLAIGTWQDLDSQNSWSTNANAFTLGSIPAKYTAGFYHCDAMIVIPQDASATPGSYSFAWEIVAHWEVRGSLATTLGTVDPADASAYQNIAGDVSQAERSLYDKLPTPQAIIAASDSMRAYAAASVYALSTGVGMYAMGRRMTNRQARLDL